MRRTRHRNFCPTDLSDKTFKLSIVISTWNSMRYLPGCIESIREMGIEGTEIIVIDSNSKDGTKEFIENHRYHDELNMTMCWSNQRMPWSEANQIGLDLARGEWICLSNPDVLFNENFVRMFNEARGSGKLAVAPQLVWPDGRFQIPAKIITPWISLCAHARIFSLLIRIAGKPFPNYHYPYDHDGLETPVDCPQGSLVMFHRKVLDMFYGHLWNPGYLNGVSDLDMFLNFKRAGIKFWLFPQYKVIHFGSYISKRYPDWIERDQAHGLVIYFRRWFKARPPVPGMFSPRLYSFLFGLESIAAVGVGVLGRIFKHRNPFFRPRHATWIASQRIMGIIDGWRQKIDAPQA